MWDPIRWSCGLHTSIWFVKQRGGLAREDDYPYNAADGSCDASKANSPAVSIDGHETVPVNNEDALLKAAANQPISVAIDAGGSDFQFYSERGGLAREDDYPYNAADGSCDASKANSPAVSIDGHEVVPVNNEDALLKAAANQPISVAIDAGEKSNDKCESPIVSGIDTILL
ncbi:hypothetical protein C3L33_00603, partial [Rhododendron williamsianum]